MASQDRRKYKRRWISAKRAVKRLGVSYSSTVVDDDHDDDSSIMDARVDDAFASAAIAAEPTNTRTEPIDVDSDVEEDAADTDSRHVSLAEYVRQYEGSSESESDADDDRLNDIDLAEALGEWVGACNVKHNAVDQLLKVLAKAGHQLPSTARSLLNTDRHVVTSTKSGMQYLYLDLAKQLQEFVIQLPRDMRNQLTSLEITINIDGLPLFKSSSTCLWPVLCAVVNVKPISVFTAALSCGTKKPSDLDFLSDVITDLKALLQNGITAGYQHVTVNLKCVICDAPARAMIKAIKLYSGYAGCDKCVQSGRWLGRITFPEVNSELRTDASFRTQMQDRHHNGYSPFCELPLDMVTQFPVDYMHQCCLGVMRKLILTWMGRGAQRKGHGARLSAGQIDQISCRLEQFRQHVPSIFARQPRGLHEVDRWKATEFRLFMLYIGKIVLKDILQDDFYIHFLNFNVALAILISPALCAYHSNYAGELLINFVERCHQLYGEEFLVYNVHSLTHIAADAVMFGDLDSCSGFAFENYLQQLKRLVRSGRNPLVQIAKRLREVKPAKNVKVPKSVAISTNAKNNVYILDSAVGCEVLEKDESQSQTSQFRCRLYRKARPLFASPCDSRIIGAFVASARDAYISSVDSTTLTTKAIMIPLENSSYCFMAVLHCV